MRVNLVTAPTIEPISLSELKLHLRLDSGSFADNIDETQSIFPGDHATAAAYSLDGTAVEVLGYTALVELISGTNGAGGTVDIKIQECDTFGGTYTDWSGLFNEVLTLDVAPGGTGWVAGDTLRGTTSGKICVIVTVLTTKTYVVKDRSGTFTLGEIITNETNTADQGAANPVFNTLTEANDNATYEKAYTGTKRYIKTVATVTTATCDFGTTIIRLTATSIEDDDLNDAIKDGRETIENITRRGLLTQTWNYYLDDWPDGDVIKIPFGNLQDNDKATGTITSNATNVTAGDTVTIDTKVYTFVATPATEGDVKIGATAAITLDNLKAAINHTGTPDTDYKCAACHPTVEATTNTDTVQTLQAIIGGVAGNSIALAKSTVVAATLTVSAATLTAGATTIIVKYRDADSLETTLDVTTDYIVETNGEECGRIVLAYEESWPTDTLYPSNPITIQFNCGWTTTALVPKNIKRAVKFAAEDSYYHGNRHETLDKVINNLLASYQLWDEF